MIGILTFKKVRSGQYAVFKTTRQQGLKKSVTKCVGMILKQNEKQWNIEDNGGTVLSDGHSLLHAKRECEEVFNKKLKPLGVIKDELTECIRELEEKIEEFSQIRFKLYDRMNAGDTEAKEIYNGYTREMHLCLSSALEFKPD